MEVIHKLTLDGRLDIIQDTELNCFTFDSLLLANFVKINKRTKYITDLCTGNAPVAILLNDKYGKYDIKFKAIEIQEKVSKLAVKSVQANNMEENIEVINDNLIDISNKIGKNKYNIITCNPPYFKVEETSNINPDRSIAQARHEISVNFEQIVLEAKKLLDNIGVFCFVHRPERLDELIIVLEKHNFVIKRLQFVYPYIDQEANTVLIEAKKGQSKSHMKVEKPVIVYKDVNEYTKQALDIMDLR